MLLLVWPAAHPRAATLEEVSHWVEQGRWQDAQQQITQTMAQPGLDFPTREAWRFQIERMNRMRLDFSKTRDQTLRAVRHLAPGVTEEQFERWDKSGRLEFLAVDGARRYFQRAANNLFLLEPDARALRGQANPALTPPHRLASLRRVLTAYDQTGQRLNSPRTWRVTYTLKVKAGVVPAGETIRAWLPFPQTGGRQTDIRLLSAEPPPLLPTGADRMLSSVYMEQTAREGQPTSFGVCFRYTTAGAYQPILADQVRPVTTNRSDLVPFLAEQPPHLVFSEAVRKVSQDVIGTETNPYLKARRLFQWVSEHIPWAGAREYSTLECLPAYALQQRHGDCGIQTMLFMTLCRLNGIPARWESGWTTGPDRNMHDWCQIYLEPYGWVPVDVSYGLVSSESERERWFYLGGIEPERWVVNTDHSQPLYPAKTYWRSEFVDFQRGEVEWRGGNLYFDQWDWDFTVQEVSPSPPPGATNPAASK